jgi:hypothetical protein
MLVNALKTFKRIGQFSNRRESKGIHTKEVLPSPFPPTHIHSAEFPGNSEAAELEKLT